MLSRIIQVMPANGERAVFAVARGDAYVGLETRRVMGWALRECWEDGDSEEDRYRAVVGLLANRGVDEADDMPLFVGYVDDDESPTVYREEAERMVAARSGRK